MHPGFRGRRIGGGMNLFKYMLFGSSDGSSNQTSRWPGKHGRNLLLRYTVRVKRGHAAFRCLSVLTIVQAAWWVSLGNAHARAHPAVQLSAISVASAATPSNQQNQINDLKTRVDDLEGIVQLMLAPIAILIGILSLGGALGVVFSLRDQRRLSQFHELAVSSEISSQRRSELSYSSFLEERQKTLTLVNQTLDLAREATDQAAHTMERKAAASLASIEASARDLLQPLLDAGEFESIAEKAETRTNLETVAGELRAIEGYLLLQDIDLQPHSRFVKGIAQYLADDANGALRTLRQAAQDSSIRELQLFSIYWDAYLNIALGRYAEAEHIFEWGRENLPNRALEHVEFDRMIDDTRFFKRAAEQAEAGPLDRFEAVAPFLIDLEKLSDVYHTEETDSDTRTSHEIADTRGDLLSWIAYQKNHLYTPLSASAVAEAGSITLGTLRDDGTVSIKSVQGHHIFDNSPPDAVRAWALMQAQKIYRHEHVERVPDLTLTFGRAECDFMLGNTSVGECINAYKEVHLRAITELGSHHEHRKSVELAQVVLVCACRLLYLHSRTAGRTEGEIRNEETEVMNAHLRVQETLSEMRDHKLTIYSPLQRRPLNRTEFADEAEAIRRQALQESS